MPHRSRASFGALLLFAWIATALVLAGPMLAETPQDGEPSRAALQQVRVVGTAMMAWLTDEMVETTCPDTDEGTEADTPRDGEADWSLCPAISHEQLAEILVPAYLHELPATDPWGGELEFCLAVEDPCAAGNVLGIRSAGRDRQWEGGIYTTGPFPPEEVDRDVLWIDGMFMTWPERDPEQPSSR